MFTNTCRLVCMWTSSLVPRPNHVREERVWRHLSRLLVLQAQQSCDYLHIFVLTHVMVRRTKKTLQCPQSLFPSLRWGLGTRLSGHPDKHMIYAAAWTSPSLPTAFVQCWLDAAVLFWSCLRVDDELLSLMEGLREEEEEEVEGSSRGSRCSHLSRWFFLGA